MRTRRSTSAVQAARFLRAAAVLLVAAVLSCAPGIAQAVFTATATGHVSASTLSMAQPAGASITASCTNLGNFGKWLRITVNNYGTVPGATSLQFIVTSPAGVSTVDTDGTYNQLGAANGTWTAHIRGIYDVPGYPDWTGTPYTRTVVC